MAKLIVNPTSSSRREVSLARTLLSVGRDPSNDIVLPDAMVSRRHAVIEYRGNQYYLRDCNSSNGSLVNGDRVSEKSLRDGDLVAIGTARLLFRDDLVVEDAGKVVHHPSAPRLVCPSCQADHRKGDAFCRQCGGVLAPSGPPRAVCTACGTAVLLPARFCNACGQALPREGEAAADTVKPTPRGSGPLSVDPGGDPSSPEAPAAAVEASSPSASTVPPDPAGPTVLPEDERHVAAFSGAAARALAPSLAPTARPVRSPTPATAARLHPQTPARPLAEPAAAGPRLAAALLDALVVAAAQAVVLVPIGLYWSGRPFPTETPLWAILLSVGGLAAAALLGALYYVHFWGVRGATPGKRWLGLAVEGSDGRFPIGRGRASFRLLGYALSGAVLGIGFLMVAFGGLGLHDRIAGTRVVRRPRE
jgi:uncharacterized RDD family membrane protein YckC